MNLEEAEAALAALEAPHQAVHRASADLAAARFTADPAKISAAQAALSDAVKAKIVSGVTDRHIDLAAQVVLDARPKAEK